MNVRDRDFGSWKQAKLSIWVLIHHILEFWELCCTIHHLRLYNERRVKLGKTVLSMEIQIKVNQRPLQLCAHAFEHVKTRPGQLYAAIKVNDVEVWPNLPVRL